MLEFLRLFGFCLVGLRLLGLLLGRSFFARDLDGLRLLGRLLVDFVDLCFLRFRRGGGIHLLLALRRRDASGGAVAPITSSTEITSTPMLASGTGSRQNAMNSPACNASDTVANAARRRRLRASASPGRCASAGSATAGAVRAFAARAHEWHDIAEIGAGVIGRQRMLRARGHDRVEGHRRGHVPNAEV